MSFRLPRSLSEPATQGLSPLDYELAGERADALGRLGRKAEKALDDLMRWKAGNSAVSERETVLAEASEAVWALFIQREICGLRNDRNVIDRYGIPGEVLARLGVVRKAF